MNQYIDEIVGYLEKKGLGVRVSNERNLEIVAIGSFVNVSLAREGFYRTLLVKGASFPERAKDGNEYKIGFESSYSDIGNNIDEVLYISIGNLKNSIKISMKKI
jgi:hypothetical protein